MLNLFLNHESLLLPSKTIYISVYKPKNLVSFCHSLPFGIYVRQHIRNCERVGNGCVCVVCIRQHVRNFEWVGNGDVCNRIVGCILCFLIHSSINLHFANLSLCSYSTVHISTKISQSQRVLCNLVPINLIYLLFGSMF